MPNVSLSIVDEVDACFVREALFARKAHLDGQCLAAIQLLAASIDKDRAKVIQQPAGGRTERRG